MAKKFVLREYKGYRVRSYDPAIALILTVQDEKKVKSSKLSKETNVSVGTYGNWRRKKTKRPQFCTLVATARALKCERDIARLITGNEYR